MTRPFTLPPVQAPSKPAQAPSPPATLPRGTEKFAAEAEKRLSPTQRSRMARVEELIRADAYVLSGFR